MYKLVVLFAVVAVAASAPSAGLLGVYPAAHSAVIVGSHPTSISHTSSSIVHRADIIAPVLHAAPIVHTAPYIHSAHLVHAAPLLHTSVGLHHLPLPYGHHGLFLH